MFPFGDPYKKLHRRRRRSPRTLALIGLALLLVGCAAAAAILVDSPARAASDEEIVAMLTARDAVRNAAVISVPTGQWVANLPEMPETLPEPTRWSPGRSVTLSGEVRKNQSIGGALGSVGIRQSAIHELVTAMEPSFDFRRSRPGDAWEVEVSRDGRIEHFLYRASAVDVWEVRAEGEEYVTQKVDVPVETRVEVVSGTIESSLWQTFQQSGAGGQLAVAYADIFAYTVDFATETQPGDRYAVAYESTWLDGERLSAGRIVGALYDGAAGRHYAFYWKGSDDEGGYYDEEGESVERQFLRSPLKSVRITSSYGRRFHPVLERMKMHAGVDYGAPTGTPVQAVADGRVSYAGWKGANGKLIAIRHANGYTTYYAHLSKIASGVRPGARVKKKEVIGRVGSTGRSTGPHLHFGMKKNGRYVNPLEVDYERGVPLRGDEKRRYLAEISELRPKL